MCCILMYLKIQDCLVKKSKVFKTFLDVRLKTKVRAMLVGAEMQNLTVQIVELHCFPVINMKYQKKNVFHMCRNVTNTVKTNQMTMLVSTNLLM